MLKTMDQEKIRFICLILLLIGGINYGLVGLFNIDLIGGIFGHILGRLIAIVIGAAAGYLIYLKFIQKSSV